MNLTASNTVEKIDHHVILALLIHKFIMPQDSRYPDPFTLHGFLWFKEENKQLALSPEALL